MNTNCDKMVLDKEEVKKDSSSSGIGEDSDKDKPVAGEEEEDESTEVQSTLDDMDSVLGSALGMRSGISPNYSGRSESFLDLSTPFTRSDSAQDLGKPADPDARKRKISRDISQREKSFKTSEGRGIRIGGGGILSSTETAAIQLSTTESFGGIGLLSSIPTGASNAIGSSVNLSSSASPPVRREPLHPLVGSSPSLTSTAEASDNGSDGNRRPISSSTAAAAADDDGSDGNRRTNHSSTDLQSTAADGSDGKPRLSTSSTASNEGVEYRSPKTRNSLKRSDDKSDPGVSSKSGNPFSCFGGASSEPKGSSPAVSTTQPQHIFKGKKFATMIVIERKMGTVVVVYNHRGKRLYMASDSRLNIEVKEIVYEIRGKGKEIEIEEKEQESETKGKEVKKHRISYEPRYGGGLRFHVEEVAEKIIVSDDFLIGIAGDFGKAHELCVKLREGCSKAHDYLVEQLDKHCNPEKDNIDTDFVLVTPDAGCVGNSFRISHITDRGTFPMQGNLLCIGHGGPLATSVLEEKLRILKPETDTDIVNSITETIYRVAEEDSTVGGTVVVTISEVENTERKELKTQVLKFPPLRIFWPIIILSDGIHLKRDCLIPAVEEVWDKTQMENIMEPGATFQSYSVKLRVYPNVANRSFYRSSEYLETKDFRLYTLLIWYDQDIKEFIFSKDDECDEEVTTGTEQVNWAEFDKLIIGREIMFYDNENEVFVIC